MTLKELLDVIDEDEIIELVGPQEILFKGSKSVFQFDESFNSYKVKTIYSMPEDNTDFSYTVIVLKLKENIFQL